MGIIINRAVNLYIYIYITYTLLTTFIRCIRQLVKFELFKINILSQDSD
jgi:hypothetical protein